MSAVESAAALSMLMVSESLSEPAAVGAAGSEMLMICRPSLLLATMAKSLPSISTVVTAAALSILMSAESTSDPSEIGLSGLETSTIWIPSLALVTTAKDLP